jgi:hypothetical protein
MPSPHAALANTKRLMNGLFGRLLAETVTPAGSCDAPVIIGRPGAKTSEISEIIGVSETTGATNFESPANGRPCENDVVANASVATRVQIDFIFFFPLFVLILFLKLFKALKI